MVYDRRPTPTRITKLARASSHTSLCKLIAQSHLFLGPRKRTGVPVTRSLRCGVSNDSSTHSRVCYADLTKAYAPALLFPVFPSDPGVLPNFAVPCIPIRSRCTAQLCCSLYSHQIKVYSPTLLFLYSHQTRVYSPTLLFPIFPSDRDEQPNFAVPCIPIRSRCTAQLCCSLYSHKINVYCPTFLFLYSHQTMVYGPTLLFPPIRPRCTAQLFCSLYSHQIKVYGPTLLFPVFPSDQGVQPNFAVPVFPSDQGVQPNFAVPCIPIRSRCTAQFAVPCIPIRSRCTAQLSCSLCSHQTEVYGPNCVAPCTPGGLLLVLYFETLTKEEKKKEKKMPA